MICNSGDKLVFPSNRLSLFSTKVYDRRTVISLSDQKEDTFRHISQSQTSVLVTKMEQVGEFIAGHWLA